MSKPKVSVCITTYNRPAWLADALATVVAQRGVSFEVLVLDNGSDAPTAEVLAPFRDNPQFRLFRVEKNGDPHTSLMLLADGDYVTNLPDDDLLVGSDSLARRAAVLDANPALLYVFTSVLQHTAMGVPLGLARMGHLAEHDILSGAMPLEKIRVSNHVPYPSAMIRNGFALLIALQIAAWERLGPATDWMIWAYLSSVGDQAYLAHPSVSLRTHPDQETTRSLRDGDMLRDHLAIWYYWLSGRTISREAFATVCSSFAHLLSSSRKPSHSAEVEDFITLLRDIRDAQ